MSHSGGYSGYSGSYGVTSGYYSWGTGINQYSSYNEPFRATTILEKQDLNHIKEYTCRGCGAPVTNFKCKYCGREPR
jgi:hypothetical protein